MSDIFCADSCCFFFVFFLVNESYCLMFSFFFFFFFALKRHKREHYNCVGIGVFQVSSKYPFCVHLNLEQKLYHQFVVKVHTKNVRNVFE